MEQKQQKLTLRKVESQSKLYKIVIPETVQRKIKCWCYKCFNTEWSGTLFYTYTGSIEEENLTINVEDFHVSDIGTATYTEYDVNPDIMTYMVENDLLDCKMGLIHSHNTMSTFFSGTDTSTLISEGSDVPHFVSLIVNNAGNYTAMITRRVTERVTGACIETSYPTFNNQTVELQKEELEDTEETIIEAFPLTVEVEEGDTIYNYVDERYNEIMKDKKPSTGYSEVYNKYFSDNEGYNSRWNIDSSYKPYYSTTPKIEEPKLPFKEFEEETKSELTGNHLSKDVLDSLVGQLLYGSVTLSAESFRKLNVKEWVTTNMKAVFDKRFNSESEFERWITNYVDYLIWGIEDEKLEKSLEGNTEIFSIAASDAVNKLKTIKGSVENKYIDHIISALEDYIFVEK